MGQRETEWESGKWVERIREGLRPLWVRCCCQPLGCVNSLQSHGLQQARLPCPSLSPGVCSNSHPLSQWCHPNISSSVALFASCPQSFLALRSFAVSWLFTSGGQSIEASASVLPMESRLTSFRMDWLDLRTVQGTLNNLLQHHSSKASILLCSAFLMVPLSHLYMTTWKTIALTTMNLCWQNDVSAF